METKQVRLEDITVDLAIHFRDKVDQGAVARYRECLDNLPPIKLVQVEDQLLLASGLHRYYSHLDAGREEIEAETLEGTRNDAIVLGLKDNSLHGVPLTREERNRAILQLVKMGLTYVEISEIFGLHETTINKIANAEGERKRPKSVGEKGHQTRKTAATSKQKKSATNFVAGSNDDGENITSITEIGLPAFVPESQEPAGSGATVEVAPMPEYAAPVHQSPMAGLNVNPSEKFSIDLLPSEWMSLVTKAEGNPRFSEDELAVAAAQIVKDRFIRFGIPWKQMHAETEVVNHFDSPEENWEQGVPTVQEEPSASADLNIVSGV